MNTTTTSTKVSCLSDYGRCCVTASHDDESAEWRCTDEWAHSGKHTFGFESVTVRNAEVG